MMLQHVLYVVAGLSLASCHTIFVQLAAEGKTNGIGVGIRDPSYDGPITDVNSKYIACNGGGQQPTTPSNVVIDVKAGDTVTAIWRHTQQSTSSDVVDPSHKGPVMAYMKKVSNAATDPGDGSGWFKISEAGLIEPNSPSTGWATDHLVEKPPDAHSFILQRADPFQIAAGGNQSIKIPSCIAPGQYLLRAELIALHGASSVGGAQFYMECAQINVIGGTGTKTPATVSLPGAYSASDPGILFNLYTTPPPTSYKIPGPPVFTC